MLDQSLPKSWRQWFRLSVRGLIILVLIIGAGLGWIVHSARIQREAVAAIENAGGSVDYDWKWGDDGNYIDGGKPRTPKWFADLIGVDYFDHVTVVLLHQKSGIDPVIVQVGHLARLHRLDLSHSSVSDASLAHLNGLTRLTVLSLAGTSVSDAGLAHLDGLPNLEWLNLHYTQVTDAGLAHLKRLTKLSTLTLDGTRVTDAGLAHLKGLTDLSGLCINHTQVTDGGLAHLKGLTKLSLLILDCTKVSDAAMIELKRARPRLTINR